MYDPDKCYLFQDEGVYRLPLDLFKRTDNHLIVQRASETLFLYDCNESQTVVKRSRAGVKLLVTTSPRRSRYAGFQKQAYPSSFIMQTWTWTEIYLSRCMAKQQRSTVELAEAYGRYGGSARNLLKKEEHEVKQELDRAIGVFNSLAGRLAEAVSATQNEMVRVAQVPQN
ncbi:uncharacterized protein FOMMEDRAFT_163019 [Fomitiporia mediterranea MF3/22]|uniref:Uncharacterized protein n=1 Tax=Fomitiporia mediterranea (strain MF3/22) TaxID=694068 RepID=R7SGT5_FOMME|nr:uncharacterized protein FOMMEDRAFT_163019 [Fomitiporia mediterranea MF3/22]EJC97517.1 hypothetical protein FOMMEDRAFT_163019 [Fomitiporia mediterranea MF3/22]